MAELDGKEFEEVFTRILPDELIRSLSKKLGVVERERELDVVMFTRAMVIGGQSHEGGRQADMLRAYVASTGTEPARSGFTGNSIRKPTGSPMSSSTMPWRALGQNQRFSLASLAG